MLMPSLIVCGPQGGWPSREELASLKAFLLGEPRLSAFLTTIRELPQSWPSLKRIAPEIRGSEAFELLGSLTSWIDSEDCFPRDSTPPNIISTPLTVIVQIVQYFQYLKSTGTTHSDVISGTQSGGIQGFCTGILAATALACSKDEVEICTFGAVALRLALYVGAAVDFDSRFVEPAVTTKSLAVRWKAEGGRQEVERILKRYPDAYISVLSDQNSVSVVSDATTTASLSHDLACCGITVIPVNIEGRFHCKALDTMLGKIQELCATDRDLQFPPAERTLAPIRTNIDGAAASKGSLHSLALRSILTEVSNWQAILTAVTPSIINKAIVVLGFSDAIPYSFIRSAGCSVTKASNILWDPFVPTQSPKSSQNLQFPAEYSFPPLTDPACTENAIAIVGMACKYPGADSVDEFWDNIRSGASFAEEVPGSRFTIYGHRRTVDPKARFWGNFIRDPDAFDHRFFKKSSREAVQTDPQQRLLLQCAYQAIESSGYFSEKPDSRPLDIGCYVGACANDYNDNIASHPPTAFSSLGTLRAFLSGKISHYFGWTGPSMTFDTACSSSLVAIHEACKAIQLGECSRAVAGGVNVLTNPYFYQNLKAGGFLSPTGPTKAFDSKADGYCRGEGVGLVVLKKLSSAMCEKDHILGVIGGSAVNQNSNASAITVPCSQSQVDLYQKVAAMSGIHPLDVSFVEAHGTGTPVGDPIESDSLRKVFGAAERDNILHLGSVKGNIGHTEAASGVAALIKTVLMMQYGEIPRQANFTSLNPKIRPLEESRMAVPTTTSPWNSRHRAACVNNYGASGSNAAALVYQSPELPRRDHQSLRKYPLMVFAHSRESLEAYRDKLLRECNSIKLSDVAYNLAIKQNRSLPNCIATTVSDSSCLEDQVKQCEAFEVPQRAKPLVLVFGGQESATVTLSKGVYTSSALIRHHLDQCDSILRSSGYRSLYPSIFEMEPQQDVVQLHSMLFSLQYSIARSWLDAGAHVDGVVGHSFGQLTALCISECLTLEACLKLVVGRATLVRDRWGSESGNMIALEIEPSAATKLAAECDAEVACYNGPTSQVLVGSKTSVERVREVSVATSVKHKSLDVTNGFHSKYTEPLLPSLRSLANELTFQEPKLALETCSKSGSWTKPNSSLIVDHTRRSVYFQEAIERITARLGPCTWLEASSATSITSMVRRALGPAASREHAFLPLQLNGADSVGLLADTTISLGKMGHQVQFWPFHKCQIDEYSYVNLPPYQFEKTRHWLDYVDNTFTSSAKEPSKPNSDVPLISLLSRKIGEETLIINPSSEQFRLFVQGHAVLGAPLCPAPLYVELAAQAGRMIDENSDRVPCVENLEIQAPLGYDVEKRILLKLTAIADDRTTKAFTVQSRDIQANDEDFVIHATGRLVLRNAADPATLNHFSRYQRLIGSDKCNTISLDPEAEQIRGSMVYKVFSKVVTYAEHYKGVKNVLAKGHEVTAQIKMPKSEGRQRLSGTVCHPLTIDNIIQVAGLHVNCFDPRFDNEVYVSTKVDLVQPSDQFMRANHDDQEWTVFSSFSRTSEKELINDIFVFNATTNQLVMMILGARFTKVLITSLAKVLNRANHASDTTPAPVISRVATPKPDQGGASLVAQVQKRLQPVKAQDCFAGVQSLLSKTVDLPVATVKRESTPDDLGVDSLMVTEVLSDIQQTFGVEMPLEDFTVLLNVQALCDYLDSRTQCSTAGSSELMTESTSSPADVATPATDLDDTCQSDDSVSRLAKLVTEHLETTTMMEPETSLADLGMDSLIGVELLNDIEKIFGARIQMEQMSTESTFGDLCKLALPKRQTPSSTQAENAAIASPAQSEADVRVNVQKIPATLTDTQEAFEAIRYNYANYASETGFSTFWSQCYPAQARLVVSYVVEAFAALQCPLQSLKAGEKLPGIRYEEKHSLLVNQLYEILVDASLINQSEGSFVRSDKAVDQKNPDELLRTILQDFPQHVSEHKLLHITGSRLADCLSGKADPLQLLFRSKENRQLLEDVYTDGPMYAAITKQLGSFFEKTFTNVQGQINILELGGGTGGTTKYILNHLTRLGIDFQYTFTDLSGSLVTAAKKKFAGYNNIEYRIIDIEQEPTLDLCGKYHAILSTNCIHATSDLTRSGTNILKMLRLDGFLSLVEFTRNLFWFDLVFGLLDGWWFFNDGRKHVLADENFWDASLRSAGFKHVTWTTGDTPESNTLRIIVGFPEANKLESRKPNLDVEAFMYKKVDQTPLYADMYYPPVSEIAKRKSWPIALMIHGGGHIMLSRKDVRPKQTQHLLENGYLPISIDYRLCPEVNIVDGSIVDVCDALQWARNTLPNTDLRSPGLKMESNKIVVVGWSTGGTLAMSLAWTSISRGIKPPDAILAFYCPTDYAADCWKQPNIPEGSASAASSDYDLLEGVQDKAITSYNVPPKQFALGGWMSPTDPRSRIVLHMNWKGQALPVLLNGLPSKAAASSSPQSTDYTNLPQPSEEQIASISPLAQVHSGTYGTPTYLIHGTKDDLIPWQQSQHFVGELREMGVHAEVDIVEGKVHLFDLYRDTDGSGWESVKKGYKFLFEQSK